MDFFDVGLSIWTGGLRCQTLGGQSRFNFEDGNKKKKKKLLHHFVFSFFLYQYLLFLTWNWRFHALFVYLFILGVILFLFFQTG